MKTLVFALALVSGMAAHAGGFNGSYICQGGESVVINGSYGYLNGARYLASEGPVRGQPQSILIALYSAPSSAADPEDFTNRTFLSICQKQ